MPHPPRQELHYDILADEVDVNSATSSFFEATVTNVIITLLALHLNCHDAISVLALYTRSRLGRQ